MSFSTGDFLGRYEILGALGAGGMGQVYRARDTDLDRQVAVKVLLEEVAEDPNRIARFEREAKLMAFFGYVCLDYPHTKFVVYSRGRGGQWPEDEQAAWVREAEARFPHLEGRISTFKVPGDNTTATFRDPETARLMRERVIALLQLEGKGDE